MPADWPDAGPAESRTPLETPTQPDTRPRSRAIYLLPNLLTTGCLFAGFYAVVFSLARIVQKNFQQLRDTELMVAALRALGAEQGMPADGAIFRGRGGAAINPRAGRARFRC